MARLEILATLIPAPGHTVDVALPDGTKTTFPTLVQAEDYCLTVLGASSVASTAQGNILHAYGAPAESAEAKPEALTRAAYTQADLANALAQWHARNNSGEGYGIGDETQTPAQAARDYGWTIVGHPTEQSILCIAEYHLALVCDAGGPWAVDMTLCDECGTILSVAEIERNDAENADHDGDARWCDDCAETHQKEMDNL